MDVILDKWCLKEGQDKYKFMEQMVTDPAVEKVLILSDCAYASKADSREGGVGTETQIISSDVYGKADNTKFIPVICEYNEHGQPCLPTYIRNAVYIDLSSDARFFDEYEKLLRVIYDKPAHRKPKIGKPPAYITEDTAVSVRSRFQYERFCSALGDGSPSALGNARDALDSILAEMHDVRIDSDKSSPIDDLINDAIAVLKPQRDVFVDLVAVSLRYGATSVTTDALRDFWTGCIEMIDSSSNSRTSDHWHFLIREMFVYSAALLIKHGEAESLSAIVREVYPISRDSSLEYHDFCLFDLHSASLDHDRNHRLGLNRVALTADLISERADRPDVPLLNFMEADFVLCLRSLFDRKNTRGGRWFPKWIVYQTFYNQPFPVFVKAETTTGLARLLELLALPSIKDLAARIDAAYLDFRLDQWRFDFDSIEFRELMNLKKLLGIHGQA